MALSRAGSVVVQETLFHKLVELIGRDIMAGFDADGAAAVRALATK